MDPEFLAELFEPVGRVAFRRMFGGIGIYRDGLMFGLVAYDTIHLKVDDGNRPAYEAEGSTPFTYGKKDGGVTSLGYWRLPERLLDEPDELRQWALAAVDAAIRSAAAKPKKKPRPRRAQRPAGDEPSIGDEPRLSPGRSRRS